jgi:HD superfamily phosphohydrolase
MIKLKKSYLFYALIIISISFNIYYFKQNLLKKYISFVNIIKNGKKYETILGDYIVTENILIDALENNALKRMKNIDQGGPLVYFNYSYPFSRYDHCVGVWALIRRFGGDLSEQLAGLYHDISHTAFSHIADTIFRNNQLHEHSYQDSIHLWYIKNSSAYDICKKYNIELEKLNPDLPIYAMLERPLPDMCADRIEYNLHTAYVYNILSKDDIEDILSHLHYEVASYYKDEVLITEKIWFFDNLLHAKKFAFLPLHFIRTIWNSSYNMVFYKFFSHLMQYAFSKGYITKDSFHFGADKEILSILYKLDDPYVIYMLKVLSNIFDAFEVIDSNSMDYDENLRGKFRGIDPLVRFDGTMNAQRLSELDFEFNYLYYSVKADCKKGYNIKYKKVYDFKDFN